MKGLLVKDIKLMKNQSMFFVMIVLISIACSAAMESPFFAMGYATALISIFSINTISYDEYDNGMPYLFSMPISRKIYVREKYLFATIIIVTALSIATLISAGTAFFRKMYFPIEDWAGILTLSVTMVIFVLSVLLPVRMKYDAEKHKFAMLIAFGAVFLIAFGIFKALEVLGVNVDAFFEGIMIGSIWKLVFSILVIGALMIMISYNVSVKIMEKREF